MLLKFFRKYYYDDTTKIPKELWVEHYFQPVRVINKYHCDILNRISSSIIFKEGFRFKYVGNEYIIKNKNLLIYDCRSDQKFSIELVC